MPVQNLDGPCSPLSIVYKRTHLPFGRNREGRGFTIVQRLRARDEISKESVLLVGHFTERHRSIGHQAMQKSVFALRAARFVFKFRSYDLWDDDAVWNGGQNMTTVGAGVEVDQNTRIENQRPKVINE